MAEDGAEHRLHGSHTTLLDPAQIGGVTRFYEKEFPEVEDCVVVKVMAIAEMGAYVQLLEYNGVEGMILLSELSRRRIRSINRLIRIGRDEVVMVIRVDKEKGYIDLSKRRVYSEDVQRTDDRFNKAKTVHSIVKHVSAKLQVPMANLYPRLAWPLYKTYGHAYDAFTVAVSDPDSVLGTLNLTPAEKKEVIDIIKQKMTPQPLKVRADVQVTCFTYEGIEAIREALMAGQSVSTEKVPIRVQLVAPPLYVMTTQCLDKLAGIEALTKAIALVKEKIEAKGGQLNVKQAPAVTSASDDSELKRMLEDLEQQNAEVSGDDDADEDEEDEAEDGDEKGKGKDEEEEEEEKAPKSAPKSPSKARK